MGDEIEQRHFNADDFSRFRRALDLETEDLARLFDSGRFSRRGDIAGFELEAWIVDADGEPLASNDVFLEALDSPLVVPELAEFNVELNGSPTALTGRVFTRLHDELAATWSACCGCAERLGFKLATIGILPTIKPELLNSDYMSHMVRYQALNDRIMALRDGQPLEVCIEGSDELRMSHSDVMLEAAATSFQIHLQCKPDRAVRDFNAAIVASAPMVALAANSPFLFGKALWDETRIPLFEQAVSVGPRVPPRVGFGTDYAHESLFEIFLENQREHPILIPFVQSEPPHKYSHLRFQNGTVWRWNRPLIGFDFDGQTHLRIEHRVVPAGPTIEDCVANAAVFFGLVRALVEQETPVEQTIDFEQARDNFYAAARDGLRSTVVWSEGPIAMRKLLLEDLLPRARAALIGFEIPADEVDHYIGIVAARVESGQNGATWQRRWVEKHGRDFNALTLAYLEAQQSDTPVHDWPV